MKSFDDLSTIVRDRAVLQGTFLDWHEAERIAIKLRTDHAHSVTDEQIDTEIKESLQKPYVQVSVVHTYMQYCAELGLKIDTEPDYPIQLHYSEGKFVACYEPNYAGVIDSAESDTPEAALESLVLRLKEATKS